MGEIVGCTILRLPLFPVQQDLDELKGILSLSSLLNAELPRRLLCQDGSKGCFKRCCKPSAAEDA